MVIVGAGLGLWFGLGGSGPPSDEKQIRTLFSEKDIAYNNEDGDAYNAFFCAAQTMDKTDEQLRGYREGRVPADSDVVSVEMRGEDAASVEVWEPDFPSSDPGTYPLVRENGKWVICFDR